MAARVRIESEKGQAQFQAAEMAMPDAGDQHARSVLRQEADRGASEAHMDQTSTQRRVVRAHYRSLKDSITVDKETLMQTQSNIFDSIIDRVDNLHAMVQRPREQIADAEAVLDLSSTLLGYIKGAQLKGGVSPSDFIRGVIRNFGVADQNHNREEESGSQIDWGALGIQATTVLCEVPGISTMLGPMDIMPKQRKVPIVRRKRDRPSGITRPEEVEDVDEASRQAETDKNMEAMFKILRTSRSVQLEALVLNRVSFSQTVENIFALSFLVKDGRAEMSYGEDGKHLVVPRNAPTAQERGSGKVVNSQFVFRFDFRDWKLMLENLEEGKELMPHRNSDPCSGHVTSLTPIRKNSRNRARETPVGLESLDTNKDHDSDDEHEDTILSCKAKRPKNRIYH